MLQIKPNHNPVHHESAGAVQIQLNVQILLKNS